MKTRVLGWAVFALQATLAVLFFFSLGGSRLDALLLASLGAVLEIVKRVSWRQWRADRHALGLVLGVTLATVSALAAIGYSFSTIERTVSTSDRDTAARAALASSLAALDAEASTLNAKASALPAAWVTSSLRYSARLGEIAAERSKVSDRLAAAAPASGASYLLALASALGVSYRALVLALLVVVAIALELAVFDLIPGAPEGRQGEREDKKVSREDLELLRLATASPGAPLLGYRRLAALAHLSVWQARQALDRLADACLVETRNGRHYRQRSML
jgi:hypothetical protein